MLEGLPLKRPVTPEEEAERKKTWREMKVLKNKPQIPEGHISDVVTAEEFEKRRFEKANPASRKETKKFPHVSREDRPQRTRIGDALRDGLQKSGSLSVEAPSAPGSIGGSPEEMKKKYAAHVAKGSMFDTLMSSFRSLFTSTSREQKQHDQDLIDNFNAAVFLLNNNLVDLDRRLMAKRISIESSETKGWRELYEVMDESLSLFEDELAGLGAFTPATRKGLPDAIAKTQKAAQEVFMRTERISESSGS